MRILPVFFLLVSLQGYSQMIERVLPGEDIVFSASFVARQKIKSVRLEKARKKDNGRIENTGGSCTWYFNDAGLATKKVMVTVSPSATLDTCYEFNYYDRQNRLMTKRTFCRNLITAVYNTFDSAGNITRIVNSRETNLQPAMELFQLGRQDISSSEAFTFQRLNEKQLKKQFLNDEGRVYKEGIIYLDSGYVVEENYRYTTTGVRMNYTFSYDPQRHLKEYTFYSDAAGEQTEKTEYLYDASGNLYQMNYSGGHKPAGEKFFFHNKQNNFLEATLCKDPLTGHILIEKFSVERY